MRTISRVCFALAFILLSVNSQAQSKPTLNHIAIYVVNLKTSTSFYKNIIGLDTIPEPFHDGKHVWFSIGPKSHLHVIRGATAVSAHEKHNHLCFSVPSIESFIAILKKNNIEYENFDGQKKAITTRPDGIKQIYFTDPDGFWIEINDARE
jgi:lactoylglutathione lyase